MSMLIYEREPLGFHGTIPIFSKSSEYSDNYERISGEHLASLAVDGTNPFIAESLWVEMEKSTISLVERHALPDDMILDVGVGLGRILSEFPRLQRYGLDISFGYLEIAQSKEIEVCYATIDDMPYRKKMFDIIVCTDVLEHVLDLYTSIAKILSVLKDDGTLIVRVPYREDLSPYLAPTYPYKYVHMRSYDEYFIRLLFERVFACDVQEMTMAGYMASAGRCKWTLPRPAHYILRRLIPWFSSLNKPLTESLLQSLYNPIEMNVVVKKTGMEQ